MTKRREPPKRGSRPRRSAGATHKACSKKRTVLKEQLRALQNRFDTLISSVEVLKAQNGDMRVWIIEIVTNLPLSKQVAIHDHMLETGFYDRRDEEE